MLCSDTTRYASSRARRQCVSIRTHRPRSSAGSSSQRSPSTVGAAVQQPFAAGVAGDADPLERHHVLHDRPALVDLAEHVGLGDAQVVEEHLVEVVRAHHAADRPDLDRRIIHRHQEDGQALLFFLALSTVVRASRKHHCAIVA